LAKVEEDILPTISVYLQPRRHDRPPKPSTSAKEHRIRAVTPFKVADVGTSRKPVCDFLLVINTNDILSRIVSKLSQIIV